MCQLIGWLQKIKKSFSESLPKDFLNTTIGALNYLVFLPRIINSCW